MALNTIHKISNITSDEVTFSHIRESDGKVCEIHKLIADRTYEDGTTDKQTTCIVNQAEYEDIQKYGYYRVWDEGDYCMLKNILHFC